MKYVIEIEADYNQTGEQIFMLLCFTPAIGHADNWLFSYKIVESSLFPTKRTARIYLKRFLEFHNPIKHKQHTITKTKFTRVES